MSLIDLFKSRGGKENLNYLRNHEEKNGCAILVFFIPILAIVGYVYQIDWLFYLAGGIVTLFFTFPALVLGGVGCAWIGVNVIFWSLGYRYTKSVLDGIILGSCLLCGIIFGLILLYMCVAMCIGGISFIIRKLKKQR